jgi:hypothetical protein
MDRLKYHSRNHFLMPTKAVLHPIGTGIIAGNEVGCRVIHEVMSSRRYRLPVRQCDLSSNRYAKAIAKRVPFVFDVAVVGDHSVHLWRRRFLRSCVRARSSLWRMCSPAKSTRTLEGGGHVCSDRGARPDILAASLALRPLVTGEKSSSG